MDGWVYDHAHRVYYHPQSATYAIPDAQTGKWSYAPASSFHHPAQHAESSAMAQRQDKEDGEVEDDVGWGGLMEPEQVEAAVKAKEVKRPNVHVPVVGQRHPAYGGVRYDDPSKYAYSASKAPLEPEAEKAVPEHILRLVVTESELLNPGDVAILDAREGGIRLGRDRCEKGGAVRIRVKEMEVSKTHGFIYWGKGGDPEQEGWWIVDLGSTHGTFVAEPSRGKNNLEARNESHRLSEPKTSSRPHGLTHLSTIRLGKTTFATHIHPSWPCSDCQVRADNQIPLDDGTAAVVEVEEPVTTVRYAMDSKERRENREVRRKREMAALRENLLSAGEAVEKPAQERRYVDRSAQRRKLHPQSPPPTRRSASPPTRPSEPSNPAPMSNFAQNMLASAGWTPGAGLGKNGDGRAAPIEVEARTEKRGLGATGSKAVVDVGPGDWKERGKARRWEEMHGA